MKIILTPEQEARLRELAAERGTDAESMVRDAALTILEGSESVLDKLNEQLERMLRC
jgi:hypothetical protein